MSDDNTARYRSSDPHGHSPAPTPGGQTSDPLAELARLIGRNDPFSEFGRESRAPASYEHAERAPAQDHYVTPQATPAEWSQPAPSAPAHGYDPFAQGSPPVSAQSYEPRPYDQHPYAAGAHEQGQPQPVVDHYDPAEHAHAEMAAPEGLQPLGFDHQADDGHPIPAPPHDDEFYDDAQPRRRKGLVTVLAVLGLAVLGTAGAFGYRSYFSHSGSSSAPPIIRNSGEPTKVAPPQAANADPSSAKLSYDRFGDRGQNEQVVSREEQPVEARDLARSNAPRGAASMAPSAPVASAASGAANPPSALGEPKRVRTVPIRPDQADGSARQQMAAVPPAPAPVAPQPQRQAAAAAAAPPLDVTPTAPPERAAPPERVRPAPRAVQPAPSSANAPLSLAPEGNANSLPPPAAREAPRQAAAPAPTRLASAPSSGHSGGYLVQVSSQRSEADAQSAFRSIQGKYSSVLGDRQAIIRRADLGEKGTYYRAMVGPFTTRDQAIQLCGSLKAAGGDCVVQSN